MLLDSKKNSILGDIRESVKGKNRKKLVGYIIHCSPDLSRKTIMSNVEEMGGVNAYE